MWLCRVGLGFSRKTHETNYFATECRGFVTEKKIVEESSREIQWAIVVKLWDWCS